MSKTKDRNIEFLPGIVKYNAIKKFDGNVVKIPSYVIAEVITKKCELRIYHKKKLVVKYGWDNVHNYIRKIEEKLYKGKFRDKNITYKLNQIQV